MPKARAPGLSVEVDSEHDKVVVRVWISNDRSVGDVWRERLRGIKSVNASADKRIILSRVAASSCKCTFVWVSLAPDVN